MSKRAAIYIRVSSERQAEGVSPNEQEEACRKLAQERGYSVVSVYRDIEKYRVRGKVVEPSGARADRPGLRQMVTDGKNGYFDIIIAWKEDRLYRGLRPMLEVIELVEEHKISIELVKETFDARIAPVKAWAAKMELDSIKERTQMGRIGRAKQGKTLGGPGTGFLGYDIHDGRGVINEEEAEIVRFIFDQVAWGDKDNPGGVNIVEVRRRLIAKGYRQKNAGPHRVPWARGVIYSILNCETYLGTMKVHAGGQVFDVSFPPLIDRETFDRAHTNMQQRRKYPARNARELGFLLMGKVYGPCGHRLHYRINRYNHCRLADGTKVRYTRKKPLAYGTCSVSYLDGPCDFRQVIRLGEVEQAAWDKIAPFLLDPQNIKLVAQKKVSEWVDGRSRLEGDYNRLKSSIAKLQEERQWIITQGRKRILSDKDVESQLAMIGDEEREAHLELSDVKRALNANDGLLQMVDELAGFLKKYEGELIELAAVKIKDMELEQRRKVQRWFDAVVVRVDLCEGDEITIQTDFFGLLRSMLNWSTSSHRH